MPRSFLKNLACNGLAVTALAVCSHILLMPEAYANAPADPDAGVMNLPYRTGTPKHGGHVLLVEGTAKSNADDRFSLEGLAVTQPVVVVLMPKDASSQLNLTASKWNANGPKKQAGTGAGGLARMSFRAQSGARLAVRAQGAGGPYQMLVWVGPELKPAMKSPFSKTQADVLRKAKPLAKPSAK